MILKCKVRQVPTFPAVIRSRWRRGAGGRGDWDGRRSTSLVIITLSRRSMVWSTSLIIHSFASYDPLSIRVFSKSNISADWDGGRSTYYPLFALSSPFIVDLWVLVGPLLDQKVPKILQYGTADSWFHLLSTLCSSYNPWVSQSNVIGTKKCRR